MAFYLLSYTAAVVRTSDLPDLTGYPDFVSVDLCAEKDLRDFVSVVNVVSTYAPGALSPGERAAKLANEVKQVLGLHPNQGINDWEVKNGISMPSDGGWITLVASTSFGHPVEGTALKIHDTGVAGPERYLQCWAMFHEFFVDTARVQGDQLEFPRP